MAQYNFTKNTVSLRQLHNEIVDSSIAEVLVGIVNSGEATSNLDIDMSGVLTAGDETTLTNLVNDHVSIVENPIVDVPGAVVMKETTVAMNGAGPDVPTDDGALCIMRGNSPAANLLWKESTGKWQAGTEGAEIDIALDGHIHDAVDITTGSFVDGRIAASNVTQHQASLVLTKSQISDFGTYLTSSAGINDLSDATISTPTTNQLLTYNGSQWVNSTLTSGSMSKVMNTWTLLSGNLYYNDFVHSLGTNKLSIYIYDTVSGKGVRPEYTEFTNTNTVRVVVNGNAQNLTANVISGVGPVGPTGPAGGATDVVDDLTPQLGGTLDMNGKSILAGAATISPTELSYLDNVTSNVQAQLNAKTTATGHTHLYRIPHTWAISGEIKLPSGQTNYILPMFISLASGQTANIISSRHRINGGTSATVKLQKNGVDVPGFTGISVTTTAATTSNSSVLSSNDMLALVVTAVSGSPQNMTFTLFIEYAQ